MVAPASRLKRMCEGKRGDGSPCNSPPQLESPFCFMHDPENAEAVAQARRLGGQRRRREGTVALAYDLQGLDSVADLRRVLQIILTDTVSLGNGVARSRTLIAVVQTAAKLLEAGEFEDRLMAIKGVLEPRLPAKGARR